MVEFPSESQSQRVARFKRHEMLECAVAEVATVGWRGLQMQTVAKRVGVSRQTVYNTFGGRGALAEALIEHLTDSFLSGFEERFAAEHNAVSQWTGGITYLLRRGAVDPALRAMLGADTGGKQFLELLTSGAEPIVTSAKARISAVALKYHPQLDPEAAITAGEIIARLALSNIVRPMDTLDDTAARVSHMIASYLTLEVAKKAS